MSATHTPSALDRSVAPEVRPLPRLTLPERRERLLDCGARLVTLGGVSCDAPVFQLKAVVSGAGRYESRDVVVPILALDLLDQGTAAMDADTIAATIEGNGAWLSRHSHSHCCEYSVRGITDTADDAIGVMLATLTAPAFAPDRLRSISEMRAQHLAVNLTKPITLAHREAKRLYWGPGHHMVPSATPDSYRNATAESLAAFHASTFVARNITFYLSGHVDSRLEDSVARAIDAAMPRCTGNPARPTFIAPRTMAAGRSDIAMEASSQAAIVMVCPAIARSHPDFEMLRLAVTGLGGYFGSRLVANLREERGLTYDISASLSGSPVEGAVTISTECRREAADEAIAEIEAEIKRFISEPPTGDEFQRLCAFKASRLTSIFDTPLTVMDLITSYDTIGEGPGRFDMVQDALERATPDELARVVADHLAAAPLVAVAR